jgi:hypothetical protein
VCGTGAAECALGCTSGITLPGDVVCGIPVGNGNETAVAAIASVSNFKGNSSTDFRRRDMMSSGSGSFFCADRLTEVCQPFGWSFAWKSVAPELGHRNREIQSRITKFA